MQSSRTSAAPAGPEEAGDGRPEGRGGAQVRCHGVVHLYRTFAGHDVVALRGIDLTINPGERVAFLGPSGCGKSTLLTLLGGIQRPSAGQVFLDDVEISKLGERRLARVRAGTVGTLLQGATRNLLPYATGTQNVAFARLGLERDRAGGLPSALELLASVGLEDVAGQTVATMSGGQRQRLALACAVATGPRILLADEPTSALGHEDRDAVVSLLHRLTADAGTTLVVVTHSPEVAETFPRTITMRDGRIGAEGQDGAEHVVMGEDGALHLPADVAVDWPSGTLVTVEPAADASLVLRRSRVDDDAVEGVS